MKYSLQAFTLLELLTVISIMSVMMLIAVFNFVGYGSTQKIRTSIIQLKGNLVTARQQAITHRTKTTLEYGNMMTTMPPCGYYVITNKDGLMGDTNYLAPGLLFSNNTPGRVTFSSDGSCPGSGSGSATNIYISEQMKIAAGGQGLSSRIRIYEMTGQAKVME